MKMNHVMLDLETLGTGSNSVIVSAGLVEFDLETGATGDHIKLSFNLLDQLLNGAEIDKDTLTWWQSQSTSAKELLKQSSTTKPIEETLKELSAFLATLPARAPNISLWGNGCTFDNVILRNLYKRSGIQFPLAFWQDKDVRTLAQLVDYDKVVELTGPFQGTKHDPINDCRHQIKMCKNAYDLLTKQKGN